MHNCVLDFLCWFLAASALKVYLSVCDPLFFFVCALSSRSAVSNAFALPPQMHPPFAFWAHRKWTWRKAKSRWYCAARRTPIRRPTLCGVGPVAPKSPVCRFVSKRTQSLALAPSDLIDFHTMHARRNHFSCGRWLDAMRACTRVRRKTPWEHRSRCPCSWTSNVSIGK